MNKINETLLKDFKKSNVNRKQQIAEKYGFKTAQEYLDYLTGTKGTILVDSKLAKTNRKKVEKVTIHNVFIMDDSSSMSGGKYNNGVEGIQKLIESIKEDKLTNNTITLIDINRGVLCWMTSPDKADYKYNNSLRSITPLYKCMGKTIANLLNEKDLKNAKVLLNITTDGQDNDGFGEFINLPQTLKNIQEKNNFTVTFIGTKNDVDLITRNLHIDSSNTLVHDNTGEGMKKAFINTVNSRVEYSASVSRGEDVLKGFYKKTGTL